jgi:hypothetical protein
VFIQLVVADAHINDARVTSLCAVMQLATAVKFLLRGHLKWILLHGRRKVTAAFRLVRQGLLLKRERLRKFPRRVFDICRIESTNGTFIVGDAIKG